MKVQYLNFELVNADSLFLDVSASAVLLKSVGTNMSRLQTELCRSSILDGWWSRANSEPNAEVSGRARWIGYTLDFECPMSSSLQLLMSFPFSLCETPSGSLCPNIRMAYEYTRSPTGVALFSRIPLGVQKTLLHGGGVTSWGTHSHQSVHKQYRPLRVLQTRCAGPAGGLGLAACLCL